jgi:hypothetical protein
MLDEKNVIRVQQAQEEKPKKTKSVKWKLFTGAVAVVRFVYRVWQFLEGDSDS